jgi:uncharacterized protein (TIGR02246 family)
MKSGRYVLAASIALATVVALYAAKSSSAGPDEVSGVRKQCSAFVEAWNKHDPKAMASVFAPDGDMISPEGEKAAGREAVLAALTAQQTGEGPMAKSHVKVNDEPIRFVTPDVAVSDAEITISDITDPDGNTADAEVHVTNVWKKADGAWMVWACRPYIKKMTPGEDKGD